MTTPLTPPPTLAATRSAAAAVPTTVTDDDRWRAVLRRDRDADGTFVYAVRSTGVFCRPSCPSRRPRRDRVQFFAGAAAAAAAGFRPCRRCRPERMGCDDPRLVLVQAACDRIGALGDGEPAPSLATLAAAAGLSPHHFQRLFTAVTGVSPRQFADALRLARLKESLRAGEAIASALYGAGYGASSRLYEQAGAVLGMTPATYGRGGRGAIIVFTIVDAGGVGDLGRILIAATGRGLCLVALGDDDDSLAAALRAEFPAAVISRDAGGAMAALVAGVVAIAAGRRPDHALPLDVRTTAFQRQVWQRLQAIPPGETRSYAAIAADLGRPGAARAVGRACAANPVALAIPCHRAIGSDGRLHGYRWGEGRKAALLAREARPGPDERAGAGPSSLQQMVAK